MFMMMMITFVGANI